MAVVGNPEEELMQQMVQADGLSRSVPVLWSDKPWIEPFPEHVFLRPTESETPPKSERHRKPDRIRVLRQFPSDDNHDAECSWAEMRSRFVLAKERHSFLRPSTSATSSIPSDEHLSPNYDPAHRRHHHHHHHHRHLEPSPPDQGEFFESCHIAQERHSFLRIPKRDFPQDPLESPELRPAESDAPCWKKEWLWCSIPSEEHLSTKHVPEHRHSCHFAQERHSFLRTQKHVVPQDPIVESPELRPAAKDAPRWKKEWLRRKKGMEQGGLKRFSSD